MSDDEAHDTIDNNRLVAIEMKLSHQTDSDEDQHTNDHKITIPAHKFVSKPVSQGSPITPSTGVQRNALEMLMLESGQADDFEGHNDQSSSDGDVSVRDREKLRKKLKLEREVDALYHRDKVLIPFLMHLATCLQSNGIPAHIVEKRITEVGKQLGVETAVYSTPTGIFYTFGSPDDIFSRTLMSRINSATLDFSKVVLLESVAEDVADGKITIEEAIVLIDRIQKKKPIYSNLLFIPSFALSSGSVAVLFGVGWEGMVLAGLIGLLVGIMNWLCDIIPGFGKIFEGMSAFLSYIIVVVVDTYLVRVPLFKVVICGVIWLVPGLSFTLGMSEVSHRSLISGSARLMSAGSTLMQMGFGLAIGIKLQGLFKQNSPVTLESISPYWNIPALVVTAISFSILMQVKPQNIFIMSISLAAAFSIDYFGSPHIGSESGVFLAAFTITIMGNIYARLRKHSLAVVPIIGGMLILVPGSVGVRAIYQLLTNDVMESSQSFLRMVTIAVSLSMGILSGNIVLQPKLL